MMNTGDEENVPTERAAPDQVMREPPTIDAVPEAPAAAPGRVHRRFDVVVGLALLLLLLIAAVATSPAWAPPVAALLPWSSHEDADAVAARLTQIEQRIEALAQRQAGLDQRLARAESQLGSAAAGATALRDLSSKVSALEQRPAPAEIDPGELASLRLDIDKLAATTAGNGERLAKLESRGNAASNERGDEALLLALGQLRTQMESAHPFAAELQAVEALTRGRADLHALLQPLAAAAAKGVPGMATLTRRFEQEIVPAVMHRAAISSSDDWGDSVLARLRSLIVIRRIGDAATSASDPAEAAVARAEAALSAGDLAGAIAAVESLPPPAAAPAQAWLAEARQRLEAEQAIARISAALTARLAADQAPQGSANAPAAARAHEENRDR